MSAAALLGVAACSAVLLLLLLLLEGLGGSAANFCGATGLTAGAAPMWRSVAALSASFFFSSALNA
jgi:hypothetical protein